MKNFVLIPQIIKGGAELQCLHFCNDLAKRNNDITLVVIKSFDKELKNILDKKVKVVIFNKKLGKFFSIIKLVFKLYRFILLNKPNRISIFLSYPEKILFPLILLKPSIEFYSFVRSRIVKPKIFGRIYGFILGNYLKNIVINHHHNFMPVVSFYKRIPMIMPNYLDTKNFNFKPTYLKFSCIYIARFIPEKNHDFIVSYIERYSESSHFPFLFCSNDLPSHFLKSRTKKLIKENKLEIIKSFDIPKLLNSSQLLIFSSEYTEGMPNAILEAMLCKIPIVCTDKLRSLELPVIYYQANNLSDFHSKISLVQSKHFTLDVEAYERYLSSLIKERSEFLDNFNKPS